MAGPRRHGHGPAPVKKAKDFKGSILKLLKYIGRYKIALAFVIIFAASLLVTYSSSIFRISNLLLNLSKYLFTNGILTYVKYNF